MKSNSLWKRVALQVEVSWSYNMGEVVRVWDWFFDYEVKNQKYYKGRRCFWPRAWVRILGLFIGVGFFYRYK